ncbi:hypothetical protein pb186bvf_000342 [Paramecium bursaria]
MLNSLQQDLNHKLKDFEQRRSRQVVDQLRQKIQSFEKQKERFNSVKEQLNQTIVAIMENLKLELQNLRREIFEIINKQKEDFVQIITTIPILQSQTPIQIQRLNERIESLQAQLTESEKNEIYLMMLNTKYIAENEELQQRSRRQKQMSQTETQFYSHQTQSQLSQLQQSQYRSKYLSNKYT